MVLGLYHIRLHGMRRISQQALQITQRLTGDDGRNCGGNVTTGSRTDIHSGTSETRAARAD